MTNPDVAPAQAETFETGTPILEVTNLRKYFPVRSSGLIRRTIGQVQAVDGVSFQVRRGSALGLVGESGCGKSTTGRLITRLYDPTSGSMKFDGREIGTLSNKEMLPLRSEIQMIFQDPYSSLNPRHTVGTIVGTPLRVHKMVPEKQTLKRVQELLEVVGLNPEHYNRYPNEFSGGQRQRIGIARRARPAAEAPGRRRAGVRPRRVDPGAGGEPPAATCRRSSGSPSCSSRTTSRWSGTSARRSR